jgi:hypothetical protein
MYQDSMPGAPPKIPVEPPESQPTSAFRLNLPPIPYPYPAPTLFNPTCPYQAQHVIDNGQFSNLTAPPIADDLRRKQAAATPTYPNISPVVEASVDQQVLLPTLPVDTRDRSPAGSVGVSPQSQAGAIDQQPRKTIDATSIAREAYAAADSSATRQAAVVNANPRGQAPTADSLPTRVVECR